MIPTLYKLLKPFHSTGLFPPPLKTSKTIFQGVSRESSGMKWFNISLYKTLWLLFLNCFRMIFLVKHSLNMSKLDLEKEKFRVKNVIFSKFFNFTLQTLHLLYFLKQVMLALKTLFYGKIIY